MKAVLSNLHELIIDLEKSGEKKQAKKLNKVFKKIASEMMSDKEVKFLSPDDMPVDGNDMEPVDIGAGLKEWQANYPQDDDPNDPFAERHPAQVEHMHKIKPFAHEELVHWKITRKS